MVSSTPRPHITPGKERVPILQEAGWAPGPIWTGGKSRPHRDSIPDRRARSQSLYRLSYRAHHLALGLKKKESYKSRHLLPVWAFMACSKLKFTLAVAQWLRCCATNRTVAGSIPAGVSGFFIDIKSFRSHYGPRVDSASNRLSTRSISWGKGGRCVRLTTYHHPLPLSRNVGTLTF